MERIELIYHEWGSDNPGGSPFDRIEDLVRDAPVDIVCPYLSLDVVRRIAVLADSWRLITDTGEWVRTQSNRDDIRAFIDQHSNRIHDCRDLHAKVILTKKAAIVGSANFTYTGLTRNTELSVYFQQTPHVGELHDWVDGLWSRTDPVDKEALVQFTNDIGSVERTNESGVSMPETGPTNEASLEFLKPDISVEDSDHERLVDRVSTAPDREWINIYFDLIREVIEFTGLKEDDPTIATTLPRSGLSRLPVNINQRYVLTAFPEKGLTGFMLPADSTAVDELSEYISDFGAFNTSSDNDPYWFEFPENPDEFITRGFKEDWKRAIERELNRGSRSPYRRYHESLAYKAAVDPDYRNKVLKEAFD
ncbi:MAG: phospholipase D-like domain-containing protein [Halanaeroarchaeum sp.]